MDHDRAVVTRRFYALAQVVHTSATRSTSETKSSRSSCHRHRAHSNCSYVRFRVVWLLISNERRLGCLWTVKWKRRTRGRPASGCRKGSEDYASFVASRNTATARPLASFFAHLASLPMFSPALPSSPVVLDIFYWLSARVIAK